MKRFFKTQWIWLSIVSIISLITIGLVVIRVDYEVTTPACITPVNSFIEFENSDELNIDVNTVSVYGFERVSLLNYIVSKVNPFSDVSKISSYQDTSDEYIQTQGNIHKRMSIDNAIISGYKKAGYEVNINFIGYTVTTIYKYATSDVKLGDVFVEFEGKKLSLEYSLQDAINEFSKVGKLEYNATVLRNGEKIQVLVRFVSINNSLKIGIGVEKYFTYQLDDNAPKYKLLSSDSIGPSGGLMQALYIYESLTNANLTKDLKIAGTGTIDENGNAGLIGGIKQKIFISYSMGCDIFFVPIDTSYSNELSQNANLVEAYEAQVLLNKLNLTKMKLVPVRNLDEVIDYLEGLK